MELPAESVIRDLVERYARLRESQGEEWGNRPMVLPNSAFFPDPFAGDAMSVQRLMDRMLVHAGMADMLVEVEVPGERAEGGCTPNGCGSGACGVSAPALSNNGNGQRLVDEGDGWRLFVQPAEISEPLVLTTELARGLGHIFAHSVGDGSAIELPVEVTGELTAIGLGFGALLLQGAHIYRKGCGGPSVARLTALSLEELALVFVVFCRIGGHDPRRAARELELTQRDAIAEAVVWADSNPLVIEKLKHAPELVSLGDFELEPPKSYLLRLLNRWSKKGKFKHIPALGESGH